MGPLSCATNFGCRVRQTLQHTLGAIVLYGLFWGTKQAAFLGLATPGPVYKGVLSGAPRHQWACRLRSLQRSAVVEVGPAELEASIRGGGAVILDIFAIWCGPCKLLEPALDKLAEQLCDGKFDRDGFPSPQVLRMDSDLHPGKATEMRAEGLPTVIFFNKGVEVGRLEGAVGLRALEDNAARLLGLAELSGGPTGVKLNSMEDVELSVQMEDVVLLGVFGGGQYEQESAALDATLQLLQSQVGDQLISTVDASRLPGLVRSLQLGGLPAVVLFQDGPKVMQLEGVDAATVTADELQEALEAARNGLVS